MHCKTYITVQVIDFPSLDDITRVGQAGPVVQHGSVVEIVDLFLALLGQLNIKHVYREVELGLGLFKVLLVEIVTSNLNSVRSQHNQWIILDTEGSDVVSLLLAVTCFVFVLKEEINCGNIYYLTTAGPQHVKNENMAPINHFE